MFFLSLSPTNVFFQENGTSGQVADPERAGTAGSRRVPGHLYSSGTVKKYLILFWYLPPFNSHLSIRCHFCASLGWLLNTGLTGLGRYSFHAFVSGLQYLTQFHVSVSVKRIYSMWQLGLGRYVQQPIRYVFDTGLADTIRIRYNTHVHEGYKIKQFGFKQQSEYFRFICTLLSESNKY